MSRHGMMKSRRQLHNTVLAKKLTAGQKKAIASHSAALSLSDLTYPVGLDKLPANFDPYDADVMQANDPQDIPRWFTRADNGQMSSVISIPSDQAGCGSCWAFAGATMYTCRIRAAMLRKYGQKACTMTTFFRPIDYCTGETGIEPSEGGVVNVAPTAIVGYQTRNRISAYYTATFSPKLRDDCSVDSPYATCIQHECRDALLSPGASSTKVTTDLHMRLGSLYPLCLGCDGNHIAMPMILYTGGSADTDKGAATIAEYNLFNWACMFGTLDQQKRFCPAGANKTKLQLFKADSYVYATASDLQNAAMKPMAGAGSRMGGSHATAGVPIDTMEELFMCEVYNYGPISIGYDVYDSFQQWGNRATPKSPMWSSNPSIYTAQNFLADIMSPATSIANKDSQGGHAVVIYGWGEKAMPDGTTLKYWRVLNSWGRGWGNLGHFYIERNIDTALANAGVPQRTNFENEMATVYFAPDPNPSAYGGKSNDMSSLFHTPTFTGCPHSDLSDAMMTKITAECGGTGGAPQLIGTSVETAGKAPASHKKLWAFIAVILIIVLVWLAVHMRKPKAPRIGGRSSAPPPDATDMS
jgi:hypothetical protein